MQAGTHDKSAEPPTEDSRQGRAPERLANTTRERLRVAVLGTGRMGLATARLLYEKQGISLVGLYSRRAFAAQAVGIAPGLASQGAGSGPFPDIDHDCVAQFGVRPSACLGQMLRSTQPHVVIQATCSRTEDALGEIRSALEHGANVISIAEEMAYPSCQSQAMAREIDALAQTRQRSVLGTGVNPGFVLDLLVIVLSGVCQQIESIVATRSNDLSAYGLTVLRSQGVGLTPEAFAKGVADGTVQGHIGFPESIAMIAATLGWAVARIEQHREPIVSSVRRETPFLTIEPGQIAGCAHTAIGYANGEPVITLIHPQQVHPQLEGVETGDRIEIAGTPRVCLEGQPEIPGGVATPALAVNMIPRIMNAPPGLHSMADLPVPGAVLGDMRKLLHGGWQ